MGAPRIISLHSILGPPDHFLRLLYGAPHVSFFSYNMGAPLRSLSLFTIWGPPQISFFACYRGATSDFSFFHKIYGALLRSVSPLTIWSPLRLVSLLTIWAGASPGFGRGGGPRIFFSDLGICMSRSDMLRMAKPCALLGGFGGMLPRENFLKWCNLVRFGVYFDQILSLKNIQKLPFFI